MIAIPDFTPDNRPYEPFGASKQLFYCRDKEILIEGPTRTGKTRSVLEKILLCMMRWPRARTLILRKTRASMTETVLQTFEDHVVPTGSSILSGPQRNHRESYLLPNGSKIVIGGLDKDNRTRVMSSEYDMIAAFEATELIEDDLDSLLTRLSNGVMPFQQIMLDCNPGPPSHWLNQRAEKLIGINIEDYANVQQWNQRKTAQGMRRLLSRLEDNARFYDHKIGQWTKMGLDYLDTIGKLRGVRSKRYKLGVWAAAEGLVYELFEERILHDAGIDPPERLPSPAIRVCAGLDWGWTDPLAIVVGAECHDGRIYLVEEWYETKVSPDLMSARLRQLRDKWGIETFYCDPSKPELIQMMRRYDIPCSPNRTKLIETGIALVETRINADYLRIYPACAATIKEASEYEYAKTIDGRTKTVPKDMNNHAMDAVRYLIAGMDFGRTLAFSPMTKAAQEAPIEPTEPSPETLARLGYDPAALAEAERREAEEKEQQRLRELLETDRGWN